MYICLECCKFFERPRLYVDTHGLDTPPYEEHYGCVYCGGAYTEAHKCDGCGNYIIGDYVKLQSGERFCENCYYIMELGEEDG